MYKYIIYLYLTIMDNNKILDTGYLWFNHRLFAHKENLISHDNVFI